MMMAPRGKKRAQARQARTACAMRTAFSLEKMGREDNEKPELAPPPAPPPYGEPVPPEGELLDEPLPEPILLGPKPLLPWSELAEGLGELPPDPSPVLALGVAIKLGLSLEP